MTSDDTAAVSMIDSETVRAWLESGEARLIDVREDHEIAAERIPGSIAMPLSRFDPATADAAAEGKLIFHCRSGQRCGVAAERMREAGIDRPIYRLEGGIIAWKADGKPVEPG